MEIVDQETKDEILSKVTRYLNIRHYYDFHELSAEKTLDKYGYYGIEQQDFHEIRFFPKTNCLDQLKNLLLDEEEYIILPIDNTRKIYIDKISIIDQLFKDHQKAHVLVADTKYNWILVKNNFNKLIGIGDPIKKKIRKKINLSFNKERIMYSLTDSKEEEKDHR